MQTTMISVMISVFAISIALASLYLSQLRGPKIKAYILDRKKDPKYKKNVSAETQRFFNIKYIISIINEGTNTGIIKDIFVTLSEEAVECKKKYIVTKKLVQDPHAFVDSLTEEKIQISFPKTLPPKESIIVEMSYDIIINDEYDFSKNNFQYKLVLDVIDSKFIFMNQSKKILDVNNIKEN